MHRSLATKLGERARYGLLKQEVLDRLARAGIYCHAYYVVKDALVPSRRERPPSELLDFAKLERDQAALVAGLPCRIRRMEEVVGRLERCACFGIFAGDGQLAGYSWAGFEVVPTVIGKGVLLELDDRGAYVFDTYVARAYRGRRFAEWLRERVHRALVALGRDQIYSLVSAHNSGALKFKARAAALTLEKRLTYGVHSVFVRDVRLEQIARGDLPTRAKVIVRPRGR